jgi:hypothetical protein
MSYCDLFFGLYPSSLYFVITTFRGMALPSSSGEPDLLGPVDRAGLYRWSTDGREEPSLETLWLQNMETMDKVQRIDRSNTVPSSKTFRDQKSVEVFWVWWRVVLFRGYQRFGGTFRLIPAKHWQPPTKIHGDTTQNTRIVTKYYTLLLCRMTYSGIRMRNSHAIHTATRSNFRRLKSVNAVGTQKTLLLAAIQLTLSM